MSRRGKIFGGVAAVLALVIVVGAWAANRALYGVPGFMLWKTHMSSFHGGHRAAVNGISLYYETYGPSGGTPVLVLHGAGASLDVMYPFITGLGNDHRIIAVDSRAQGRSTDAPGPLTYSMMGADMIALLDALHIRQADVIGWSDGGIVGLDMAMKHPDRVRRLIAIGANYRADGVAPDALSPESIAEIENGERMLYNAIAPDPEHFPVVFAKIVKMLGSEPNYTIAELGRIEAPTLIVAGDHDLILRKHTDSLAKAIPHAREIIVPNASHEGLLEQPALYTKMAREFLGK